MMYKDTHFLCRIDRYIHTGCVDHFKGKKSSKNIQAQKKWCVLCFWQKSWILSLGQAPRLRRQSHSEKTFKDRKSKDRDDSTGLSAQWCFPHLLKQPQGAFVDLWFVVDSSGPRGQKPQCFHSCCEIFVHRTCACEAKRACTVFCDSDTTVQNPVRKLYRFVVHRS